MAKSFGEPLTRLRSVPIHENGEPLADPTVLSKRIHFSKNHPYFEGMICVPYVRATVAEMIAQAAESLPAGLQLQIIQGYRSMDQQRVMYEHVKQLFAAQHPEWNKATLHRVTNTMSAPPDDRCPPPHSTGAAFDVSLIRPDHEPNVLDMCSPLPEDAASAPMFCKGLSAESEANRKILRDALEPTGLTNYAGEWWHWSYGDSGWALRTGAPAAIYGGNLKETRPT